MLLSLEQRDLMLQWWTDFLDANKDSMIRPFDFSRNLENIRFKKIYKRRLYLSPSISLYFKNKLNLITDGIPHNSCSTTLPIRNPYR